MPQADPSRRAGASVSFERHDVVVPIGGASELTGQIAAIRHRLNELLTEQAGLQATLAALEAQFFDSTQIPQSAGRGTATVTRMSPSSVKIDLFCSLFRGRADVFPARWENHKTGKAGYSPVCANEWARGICAKPQVKCGQCPHQAFVPVSDEVVAKHLRGGDTRSGSFVAGVYPLLTDETCWFLAADFDKQDWIADATAFLETCRQKGVSAALERSRSGNGGHVWIFFDKAVPAVAARQMGAALMTETMERRPEIGFASYDRFFPNQDTMPIGGFGNLIALPLQGRVRDAGNSVFIDEALKPYDDQWAFLSTLTRNPSEIVLRIAGEAEAAGRVLGVRMPVNDEFATEPWKMLPSRRTRSAPITAPLPGAVSIVVADQVYLNRTELPPTLVAQCIRLAAFQNPEFYRAQAMRLPTHGKPRIISCAELHPKHVALPRGCLDELAELLRGHGIEVILEDHRHSGEPLPGSVTFLGHLQPSQQKAFRDLAAHDNGVLAATTAFGKTVVAAALIAERRSNTLILVHRRELLEQWVARLRTFLNIDPKLIGTVGGGKRKQTGMIDVALIQSLVRRGEVDDLVAGYGHVIVDECHHLAAVSFEQVARRARARFVLGLSATVARKDGHHPIIFMQCGPVRHRVDARTQAAERGIRHRARERQTRFELSEALALAERPPMPAIYAALAQDETRNDLIFNDVLQALEKKRSPIVLTERKDHLAYLQERFKPFAKNIAVLCGGLSAAERRGCAAALSVPETEERLILATGRYIGEGFDDARLDTLFLTMPISWKGTLAQYVGRLHRDHAGKSDVLVVDYVDGRVPVLARMAARRRAGYRSLGYLLE